MEFKCEGCNKSFNSDEGLKQHNLSKHTENKKEGKTSKRKYFIISLVALIILFSLLSVYSYTKKPGEYDDFVSCLTEKGIVMYGNDYCSYTTNQLNFFGKSKGYLNYVKCVNNEKLCDEKEVDITPTWEINGESYSGVQSLEKLGALSGCVV